MKRHILLLALMMFCSIAMAQRDTLYLKGGQYFICRVTQHNNRTITYSTTIAVSTAKNINHNARQSKQPDIITLKNGRKIICKIESENDNTIHYSKITDWNIVKSIHTAKGQIITQHSTTDSHHSTKGTTDTKGELRIQYSDNSIENINYKPQIEELARQGIISSTDKSSLNTQHSSSTVQTAVQSDLQQQINSLQNQVEQLQRRVNELEIETQTINQAPATKATTTPATAKAAKSVSNPAPTKAQESTSTPAPAKAKPSSEAKRKAIAKKTGKNKKSTKHKNSKKTKKSSAKNKNKKSSAKKSSASTKRHHPANNTHAEEHNEQNETKTEVTSYSQMISEAYYSNKKYEETQAASDTTSLNTQHSTLNPHVVGISIGYAGKWMQQTPWLQAQQTYTFMGNKPITSMLTIGVTYNPEFKHGIGLLTGVNAEIGYTIQQTNTLNWTQTHLFDVCISIPLHLSYRYAFNDNWSLLLHTGPTLELGIYNGGFTRIHNAQYDINYRINTANQYIPEAQMLGKQQYEGINPMWGYGIGAQCKQWRFEIGGSWGILNRYHFNNTLPDGVSPQSIRFHKPVEAKITYLF